MYYFITALGVFISLASFLSICSVSYFGEITEVLDYEAEAFRDAASKESDPDIAATMLMYETDARTLSMKHEANNSFFIFSLYALMIGIIILDLGIYGLIF